MSTTTAEPPAPASATSPRRGWLRRHKALVLVLVGLVAATALSVLSGDDDRFTEPLDPANARPEGARAVARVLANEGIDVDVVRSAAELERARTDADTTVVITSTDGLGRRTARQVRTQASESTLVLVEPRFAVPSMFGEEDGVGYSRTRKVDGSCRDDRFDGLTLESDKGAVFASSSAACFATGSGALLTEPSDGTYFLGAGDVLANEQITRSDNAAFALRLLGGHPHLVWYVPDPLDLSADEGVTFSSLLPRWLGPAMLLLGVAAVTLILWRSRRLGALAVEPLPVAVTAIETTRSRGRLYRKVNDRGYAAGALRHAARTDIAAHLLMPRHTANDPELLVRVLGSYSVLGADRLRELLRTDGPAPASDKDLITLANDLADLLREVHRS
ncbi:hypothetical protein ABIE44_001189 [Marmoricola sp. OAE513]|uniref:DUF4350 domain-containing protein n=1 Tax=Marmoricola sp. OAE513 TaxID=2817894 RepID=UPI001AE8893C